MDPRSKLNATTCLKVLDRRNLLGIMNGKICTFEKNKVPYELYADRNVECESLEYDSCSEFLLITASGLFDYLFRTRRPIVCVVRRSFDYTNGAPGRAIYVSRSLRNPEDVRRVFPSLLICCGSSIRSSTLLPHTPEFSA
uniref:PPM-type phosphatase domain-containing protein n=1 Tax=Strongyloides papillosus TaxID=174720 RepID=A0A0N5C427_STREA